MTSSSEFTAGGTAAVRSKEHYVGSSEDKGRSPVREGVS